MNCPLCGYAMDAFDAECPRCHGKGLPEANPTTALPPPPRPQNSPPPLPGGINALPVVDLTEAPRRNTPLYVLCGLAFCGAYFAPWWKSSLAQSVAMSGQKDINLLAVAGAALAIILMLFDQLQGKKEVPVVLQLRTVISTACLAYAAGHLVFAFFLTNIVTLSFGLPVMAAAAAVMVCLDFNQLAEDVKIVNRAVMATALVAVLAWSAYQGHQVRQITNLFAGFAGAFKGGAGGAGAPSERSQADVEVTLNSATQASVLQPTKEFYKPTQPKPGKTFLICNVTVKLKGGVDKLIVTSNSINLTASNKNVYSSRIYFNEFQNVNQLSATLLPDGTTTGDVIFEVDSGATPEKVEYSGSMF